MSETKTLPKNAVRLIKGDITDIEVEAFVYYARPDLSLGAGFGNAISTRGGPSIKKELEAIGPREQTDAVVTSAGNLKAKYIVHAVGPGFQEEDIEGKLRTTIVNALKRAEEKGISQVALPPMGSGFYGIPLSTCSDVMIRTIGEYLGNETRLREVIIVANDNREYEPFERKLKER